MRLPGHRLVFVAGLHRSGTTPLARCLAGHPEVSGFRRTGATEDEGQHLQSIYPQAAAFGGPGVFAFDPRAHRTERHAVHPHTTSWRLFSQWREHWDMTRPVLLEKSPPNLIMMRYLQALFPRARFVVVLRHPVVTALATRKWRNWLPLEALVEHWLHAHDLAAADARAISRLHVLHYEHLVAEPERELARLARFLELDEPPSPLGLRGDLSRRYERTWRALGRPPRSWAGATRARLVRRFGSRCAAHGYDLDNLPYVGRSRALGGNSATLDITQS